MKAIDLVFIVLFSLFALFFLYFFSSKLKPEPEYIKYISIKTKEILESFRDFPAFERKLKQKYSHYKPNNVDSSLMIFQTINSKNNLVVDLTEVNKFDTEISRVFHDDIVYQQLEFGLCWAFATASLIRSLLFRNINNITLPEHKVIVGALVFLYDKGEIINEGKELKIKESEMGENTIKVLDQILPDFNLSGAQVDNYWFPWFWGYAEVKACDIIIEKKRPLVGSFFLNKAQWEQYFKKWNSKAAIILRKDLGNDTDIKSGHAVLIVGCDKYRRLLEIKNSWGTDGGNQGYAAMDFSFFSGDNGRLYEGYKNEELITHYFI